MKRALLALLCLSWSAGLGSSDSPAKPEKTAKPPRTSSETVVITRTEVHIGGRLMPLPGPVTEWILALGPPSRKFSASGPNELLIWDSLGLVAYKRKSSLHIHLISLYLQSIPERKFNPTSLAGPISIGNIAVANSATLEDVGSRLIDDGAKHVRRLAIGIWTLTYGDYNISLEQVGSPALQTLSVGTEANR